jgi:hypothetical protein
MNQRQGNRNECKPQNILKIKGNKETEKTYIKENNRVNGNVAELFIKVWII